MTATVAAGPRTAWEKGERPAIWALVLAPTVGLAASGRIDWTATPVVALAILVALRERPWNAARWAPYLVGLWFALPFAWRLVDERSIDPWHVAGWFFVAMTLFHAGSARARVTSGLAVWNSCLAMVVATAFVPRGGAILSCLHALSAWWMLSLRPGTGRRQRAGGRTALAWGLCAVLAVGAWLVQGRAYDLLGRGSGNGSWANHTLKGFSPVSTLGTFSDELGRGDEEVAVRVHAERGPELLQGMVFDLYQGGTWVAHSPDREWESPRSLGDATVFCKDKRDPGDAPAGWIEPSLPTQGHLLVPPRTACAAVVADHLSGTETGVLRSPLAAFSRGVWWFPDTVADRSLSGSDLLVPASLAGLLDSMAIRAGLPERDSVPLERRLARWFSRDFAYSLSPARVRGEDPLRTFFRDRRGYCEYFATAAVLLLRRTGHRARYVTGYAYPERGGGPWWTFRRANAHAWVQVLDPARGWIEFDPTPPDDRPGPAISGWGRFRDAVGGRLGAVWHSFRDGNWRKVLLSPQVWLESATVVTFVPWVAVLAAGLAGFVVLRLRRARRAASDRNPWIRPLEAAERNLARKGWSRSEGETVGAFLARLPETAPESARRTLEAYQRGRFAKEGQRPGKT